MAWKNRVAACASVLALAAGSARSNDLALFATFYATDYVTAGVGGMRNTGTGTIQLAGVTGPVTRAFLYWSGPTNSLDPMANANVFVNGNPVMGTNIGFSNDNCWGFQNSQAYRADVTALVALQGDGPYVLTGFGSGDPVNSNGASLLVFFDDGNPLNDRDIVLFDGNDSNIANIYDALGWNASLAGINYAGGTASIQLHVADGQAFLDNALLINAMLLEPSGPIFQGASVPAANNGPIDNGNLWDILSWDVVPFLVMGPNTLTLTTGPGGTDCLSLHVVVIDLPAGAAPAQGEPPVIECLDPAVLWSPNHDLVDVSSVLDISDPDSDPGDLKISIRIFSNEDESLKVGAGPFAPDFKDEWYAGGRGLLVRSERAGTGSGRFYIVIVKVEDETNNVAIHSCVLAVVPHSKSNQSLGMVFAAAAAADALVGAALMVEGFEALDPSTLGLFEHGLAAPVGPKQ